MYENCRKVLQEFTLAYQFGQKSNPFSSKYFTFILLFSLFSFSREPNRLFALATPNELTPVPPPPPPGFAYGDLCFLIILRLGILSTLCGDFYRSYLFPFEA
jgi:hypothetical protein